MDFNNLIPLFGILLVMIPVAGFTLALVLRLAVKPLVETLARAVRESRGVTGQELQQMDLLSAQVELLTDEVSRLRAERTFDRQLVHGNDGD